MNNLSSTYEKSCLANKLSPSPNIGSISKQALFKHNNVFVNMRLDLIIRNIIFLYVYLSKNIFT